MPVTEKMSRLNIAIPEKLHRQIKAAASMRGQSLKDFVIERILADDDEYDLEDVNISIAEGLRDVKNYKAGKIKLPTYQEFLAEYN